MSIWNIIAAVLSGFAGAIGIGGGGILVIYLSVFVSMEQLTAQGINLLFFLPIAVIALVIHQIKHLIAWKKAVPLILLGLIGVFLGMQITQWLDQGIIRKIFAVFLFLIGIYQLFQKEDKEDTDYYV